MKIFANARLKIFANSNRSVQKLIYMAIGSWISIEADWLEGNYDNDYLRKEFYKYLDKLKRWAKKYERQDVTNILLQIEKVDKKIIEGNGKEEDLTYITDTLYHIQNNLLT